MNNIKKISIILISLITIYSCQKENESISENDRNLENINNENFSKERDTVSQAQIDVKLYDYYDIDKTKYIDSKSGIRSDLGITNKDTLIEYSYENSDKKTYINIVKGNYFAYKTSVENGNFTINEGVKYEIINGKPVQRAILHSFVPALTDPSWCQQEPEDGSSACAWEDREYDEFTEDWVGFVAYWTNPQIAVLIAIMCRC